MSALSTSADGTWCPPGTAPVSHASLLTVARGCVRSEIRSLLIASSNFFFLFRRWYVLRTLKQPRHVFKFPSKHSVAQRSCLQLLQSLRWATRSIGVWRRRSVVMISSRSPMLSIRTESATAAFSPSMARHVCRTFVCPWVAYQVCVYVKIRETVVCMKLAEIVVAEIGCLFQFRRVWFWWRMMWWNWLPLAK